MRIIFAQPIKKTLKIESYNPNFKSLIAYSKMSQHPIELDGWNDFA